MSGQHPTRDQECNDRLRLQGGDRPKPKLKAIFEELGAGGRRPTASACRARPQRVVPSSPRECNGSTCAPLATREALSWTLAVTMLDETPTTADLLDGWRDATSAADLARRLAEVAEAASEAADRDAAAAAEVAALAEATAMAAGEAAQKARATASRMHEAAETARDKSRRDAAIARMQADEAEVSARDRYREAERAAGARRDGDKP